MKDLLNSMHPGFRGVALTATAIGAVAVGVFAIGALATVSRSLELPENRNFIK
jgi:hypothetical protein